jgi:adenosylhomocysteine nucleosidase
MTVAAITGLAAEARIARAIGLRAVAAGGDAARTRAAIERLIGDGATGLVSFGICGGLDPAVASGTVLLPQAVRTASGKRYAVNTAWRAALAGALRLAGVVAVSSDIVGVSAIVDTPVRKAALFGDSGAAADLESHLVAEFAHAAGLPFIVLRAVADGAQRGLPPAALVGLNAAGGAALGPVLMSLARRPGQLPALALAALDTRRALATLRRAAHALQAQLGVLPG